VRRVAYLATLRFPEHDSHGIIVFAFPRQPRRLVAIVYSGEMLVPKTAETFTTREHELRSVAVGREKLKGHLAMVMFTALVSGSYSLGALAAREIGPSAINGVRFAIGVATMIGVAAVFTRGRMSGPIAPWRYLILGGLMATFFITMFTALQLTDPVSTGAVFTLMPVFAAVFGYFILGQVPRSIVIASLLFAALGAVWVIFRGSIDAVMAFDLGKGEMIFLFGVICHALYAPLVKKFNSGLEPLPWFTAWTMAATGLWVALWGWQEIVSTDWAALPPLVWIVILYLSLITGAGTTFLVMYGSLKLPAAKVLAYTYLSPCLIIVYEGLLGHGWPSLSVAAGALIIVLGLIVMAVSREA
jgi:drug/metabolite transporter (DMT)-like permease